MKRVLCWFGRHDVLYRVTSGGVVFPMARCGRCGKKFVA